MKHLNKKSIIAGVLLGSLVVAGGAIAGVKDSKHNLGSSNSLGSNQTDATGEVCVFCHTPHGSETIDGAGAKVEVPLWNKKLPSAATFTTYDSLGTSSLDGAIAAVGSVSIACLSCHDGSQAMDVMVNTPKSGTEATADTVGLTAAMGGGKAWTGTGVNAAGKMINGAGLDFPMLGTDLQNDHPIGIQYAGGGITDSTTTMKDGDFFAPQKKTINAAPVWWVDTATGNAGKRDKTDMQLYTRTLLVADGGAGVAEPFVECASCHDPHNSTTDTFLRISNTGSAVCLACHDK